MNLNICRRLSKKARKGIILGRGIQRDSTLVIYFYKKPGAIVTKFIKVSPC